MSENASTLISGKPYDDADKPVWRTSDAFTPGTLLEAFGTNLVWPDDVPQSRAMWIERLENNDVCILISAGEYSLVITPMTVGWLMAKGTCVRECADF